MTEPQRDVFLCDDIEHVDHIMVSAFAADPSFAWTTPFDMPERERWLLGFLHTWHMFIRRHGGFAVMDSSRASAIITEPYHDPPLGDADIKRFHDEITQATGPAAERFITFVELLEEKKPQGLPPHIHWCLGGVLPDRYERGAIADIVNWHKGYADALGLEHYLEASSLGAMERWSNAGFTRVGDPIQMPGGEVELYPMRTYRRSAPRPDTTTS
ncbi:hypothetical protein ACIQGO_34290 [Streptomyces shenzhenensis]|uniref:hypothetical protein n=1 Tax=Streptomyces shenzhenensis TaxID=943815 RepID=UPI0038046AA6